MTKEEIKQYFIELYVEHIKQEHTPEWANWIATDADGTVWLYQEKPVLDGHNYFNDSIDGDACQLVVPSANKTFLNNWAYSLLKLEDLLPHHSSQKEEEPSQDKIEFEAVSGDQSLFDLVGAKDDDLFIVRKHNSPYTGIFAFKKNYPHSGEVLAERKVKERLYIPEVGHTYKLSGMFKGEFICVFIDDNEVIWSTCGGSMYHHTPDSISLNTIKFIRVN